MNASGQSRAAVQVAAQRTGIREFPLPQVPADAGILRVLRAGICGSDIPMYADGSRAPRILGHENVGVIETLGPIARERWGVQEGDLVALEEYLPCGYCEDCRSGEYRSCLATDSRLAGSLRYGSTGIDVWPALWGGYSQFQYLHPRAVLHRVPQGVSPRMAAMALPLGNGFQWAHLDGGAAPGQVVVVQGPGQQGLACVVAARMAGASTVIATGLARDEFRLEVARRLGADHTVVADREPLAQRVAEITDGRMADLLLDVSSGGAAEVINGGLALLRKRGKLLTAAAKHRPLDGFELDTLIRKQVTLRGVRGHSFRAVEMALELMASGRVKLELLSTHEFGLDDTDEALRTVGGERPEANAIHVAIDPWS
jgi:threonine dehydrogenase-like Zn-dependent dehydrogenase